MLQALLHHSNM